MDKMQFHNGGEFGERTFQCTQIFDGIELILIDLNC